MSISLLTGERSAAASSITRPESPSQHSTAASQGLAAVGSSLASLSSRAQADTAPVAPAETQKPPFITAFSKEMRSNPAAFRERLPPHPQTLKDFLNGLCPIYGSDGKTTAAQTHVVVPLFPTIVIDGSVFIRNVDSLDRLAKASGAKGFRFIVEQARPLMVAPETFCWAVLSKKILPESRALPYEEQVQLVQNKGYEIPDALTVATAIFCHMALARRILFFGSDPWTFTRCKDAYHPREDLACSHLMVGGFTEEGLVVHLDILTDSSRIGMAGMRIFASQ